MTNPGHPVFSVTTFNCHLKEGGCHLTSNNPCTLWTQVSIQWSNLGSKGIPLCEKDATNTLGLACLVLVLGMSSYQFPQVCVKSWNTTIFNPFFHLQMWSCVQFSTTFLSLKYQQHRHKKCAIIKVFKVSAIPTGAKWVRIRHEKVGWNASGSEKGKTNKTLSKELKIKTMNDAGRAGCWASP